VGKYGTQEQVEAITPENLYDHYRTILETSQIELTFTGQTDIDTLKAALLDALKALPRGALVHPETTEGPMPEAVRELSETMDVTQGKLVMGFRTGITAGDEQYPALLLMNSVYGGSLTSKLFMNVREKLSLCYYASSGLDRFKGVMIVSSGVDMDKFETAKAEILAQLEACRRGEIVQEELEPARSYLISSLKAGEDSAYGMEDFYVGQTIGGYTYTPDTLAQALQKVTIPEIQAVANRLKLDTIYFLKGAE
jgi:predicted Zn-dependent peptidase